ncbi:MAG: flagellar hook protein [Lachnospiraceae bacterium]|nr:flagellar hook protein [Lachnospiraceae bacterium]
MVVQHNLTAMNSQRQLGITTGAQAKSTEKLSSGFKINRAADDAAGLAISEKMRKQIRGLTQASSNAEDGISAVQTAEGALNEVHDMLQRMNELAVKAANGTQSESDRSAIQDEIDQITTEIDRVSETTKFNETYLLKGDRDASKIARFSYKKNTATVAASAKFTADGATNLSVSVGFKDGAKQADQNAIAVALKNQGVSVSRTSTYGTAGAVTGYDLKLVGDVASKYQVVATSTVTGTSGNEKQTFDIQDMNGNVIASVTVSGGNLGAATATDQNKIQSAIISAGTITAATNKTELAGYYDKDGNRISENALNKYFSVQGGTGTSSIVANAGVQVYDAAGNLTKLNTLTVAATRDLTGDLKLNLHVGADATTNNQISVRIQNMSAKSLGVNGMRVDGKTDENALKAIETVKEALQKVSDQRSALGAVQNRLEHTIKNLDNVVENTTAAESQIRDTDMAAEMVKYSNNNILSQAGQSMLAQANQSNQGVLSLLG